MKKLILVFSLIICQLSFSYEFTSDFTKGFFWEKLPLDFHISEFDVDKKRMLKEIVSSAAQVWESGVGEEIWEFEKEVSGRNIIRWATDFEKETGFDPESTLAVTIRHNVAPYWAKAEIILNPNKQVLLLSPESLHYVLMHELGHTMGLGHTDDDNSVMKASFAGELLDLSSSDIGGMIDALGIMQQRRENPTLAAASSQEDSRDGLSCGTVDLGGGDGPGGPLQFLFSLLMGALMLFLGTNRRLLPAKLFM